MKPPTPASKTSVPATSLSATPIWIPFAAFIVAVSAFIVAVSSLSFAYTTWREHRNADLVRIGVSVLQVDPKKEKQLSEATREWALDLIDANAGGVRFSPDAREQLLKEPLRYYADYGTSTSYPDTSVKPAAPRPSPEPPK